MRTLTGEERWTVEKLVPGGDGLCRLADGRIGFVTGGFPGDVLVVRTVEAHAGYLRALDATLVSAGSVRARAPCALAVECGGCDWMGLEREEQLAQKRAIVREALRRTAQLHTPEVEPVVTAGGPLGYRRRIRLHVENGRAGFYRAGGRHLVVIPECVVARPELQNVLTALQAMPRGTLEGIEAIDARHATDGTVVVRLEFRPGFAPAPGQKTALNAVGRDHGFHVVSDPSDFREQSYTVSGAVLHVTPGVFTQVNWEVNEILVEAVVTGALNRGVATFCDLYAGAGNFTLPLLAAGLSGVAIEQSEAAIESARRSAVAAGLGGTFLGGDAAAVARSLLRRRRAFDLVLLDPPRTGAREVLEPLIGIEPRAVAYVSCDPVTFARDARSLIAAGYALESVTPFDMFPHTHHVEVLAWFSRRKEAREA